MERAADMTTYRWTDRLIPMASVGDSSAGRLYLILSRMRARVISSDPWHKVRAPKVLRALWDYLVFHCRVDLPFLSFMASLLLVDAIQMI